MARAQAASSRTGTDTFAERRRLREARAETVLDAAVAIFSEHGYHGASMDEVAAAAGVSKPAVYAQFGSKEELYVACIERAAHRFHTALERAVHAADTPEQRIWVGILTLLDHVERERAGWTMLFGGQDVRSGAVAQEAARLRAETTSLIAELFTETAAQAGIGGSALEVIEPLGAAFVGTAEGVARWWLQHPEVPRENLAMYLMNYVWSGLGGMIEGQVWMPSS